MPDYLPRREGDRVRFARQLASVLAQPGMAETYGLSAGEVEAYEQLYASAAEAWRVSQTPATRTVPTVRAKDTQLAELVKQTRALVTRIRGRVVMAENGAELLRRIGLRKASRSRKVLRVPGRLPWVRVSPTVRGKVGVRVTDPAHPQRKAKPRGVEGLVVYCRVQSAATGQWSGWWFEKASTRMRFEMDYPRGAAAGDRLEVSVKWSSPTGKMGPGSTPVTLVLPPKYAMWMDDSAGRRAA